MSAHTEISPGAQRLLEVALTRRPQRLLAREQLADGVFALSFLIAAVLLAFLAPAERHLDPVLAATFVGAYALVARAEFFAGAGFAVPTEVVLVPMLLLLPTPTVPLLVALALVITTLVDAVRGRVAPERALLSVADAWYALAPALVLILGGAQTPDWSDWPIYVAALAAQVALDSAVYIGRVWACLGEHPRTALAELKMSLRVDPLLAPVGLLAAFAAVEQPYAVLLVLPLVKLFTIFADERAARMEQAIELSTAYRGTALLLGDVIEADDAYTGQHTQDVVELSVAVADRLGVDDETRRAAEFGALLHDVGKVAIPNEIINKPGPLDDEEWAIMKTHTVEGQRMLERVGGLLARVGVVVRASHERYDGGGYPDGLAGEAIPLAARIVSACDAFNAMTTDRSYRKALSLEVAIAELRNNAGTQFDPDVVDALVDVAGAELAPLPGTGRVSVAVPAPGTGAGCWAGAPSAALDASGEVVLAYRLRDAERRGGEVVVAGVTLGKERFGAESLERPALVRTSGGWRLYVSCATPGSKHWWICTLDAPALPALADAEPVTVFPGDESVGVKDPVVRRAGEGWEAWICCHPLDEPGEEDRMTTGYATSRDGLAWDWQGTVLAGRPGEWDARGARVTAVLADGTTYYDGRATKEENFRERTGIVGGGAPVADVRYLDVLALPGGGWRLFYEAPLPDGSHELRSEFIDSR